MTKTDIIIILTVILLVCGAVYKIVRDKKKGIPCTGCSSCPMAGSCDTQGIKNS